MTESKIIEYYSGELNNEFGPMHPDKLNKVKMMIQHIYVMGIDEGRKLKPGKKKVLIDINGETIAFETVRKAAKAIGVSKSGLYYYCDRRQSEHSGMVWRRRYKTKLDQFNPRYA